MERKLLILIFYFLLPALTAFAQCIHSDSLWKRLIYIRDSSTNTIARNLSEMLNYQSRIENCDAKNDTSYALLLQRIGAAYNEIGDYLKAEKYVKRAIQMIGKTPGRLRVNESQLIRSYYLLDLIYTALNRTTDRMQAIDSCIEISLRSKSSDTRILNPLLTKVENLFYIGDYHGTISYASEGEILTSKLLQSGQRLDYLFDFLIWKVNSLIFLEKYDDAEKLLIENLSIYLAGRPNDYQGIILDRVAVVKTKKAQYSEATSFFKQSLQCNIRNKNLLACMITMNNMGFYLYDKGLDNEAKAIDCYTKALQFASKTYNKVDNNDSISAAIEAINVYDNIANLYNKRGQFDSAQYYFQKGLFHFNISDVNKSFINHLNKDFLENKSIPSVINTLIDQGDSYLNQFKKTNNINLLDKAYALYANADKLQYLIKSEQREIQSQLFWRNYLRRLYEHSIETAYLIGNMSGVFENFEKSRAVLLNDQLNKQYSLNKNDMLKLSLVQTKIAELTRALTHYVSPTKEYKELHNELFNYTGDLAILEQQIQMRNPAYLKAIDDTTTIHLQDFQKSVLKDHDALLEVFDGDSVVYSLLITSKDAYLNKISKLDYERTSNEFISFISNASQINSHYTEFIQTANRLYQLIFGKLPIPTGRIIISPDGRYFPFEALVTNSKISAPDYFLQNHAVSYTYSARYLLYNFSINSSSSILKDFLGIAPVQFKNFNLTGLPGSVESLNKIGDRYNAVQCLTLSKATKENFLKNFSNYKIIQLYTHSSDSSASGEPVIYFSDSAFYLSELIPEDKPSSQLIVLSACETGNGKLYQGEGVFSFNRGFAALGIPSTITNLWSVDNESTYAITELFYKNISKRMPIDLALQRAKLEFISSSPKGKKLPYYWAAAILAGKTDAIETGSGFSWYWAATGAGIIFLSLAFFRIKRK